MLYSTLSYHGSRSLYAIGQSAIVEFDGIALAP